ncbi:MAG: hypothetical protein CYG59_18870 [Chloroflexi bacterium]|nr:MAG: hypothetical protein CYG59_18870 [Chloroflexota bacterium]
MQHCFFRQFAVLLALNAANLGLTPACVATEALRLLERPQDVSSAEPEAQAFPGQQPPGHERYS